MDKEQIKKELTEFAYWLNANISIDIKSDIDIEEVEEYLQSIESEQPKEECDYTKESSEFCSRYHDCNLCELTLSIADADIKHDKGICLFCGKRVLCECELLNFNQ